ncbi:2-amino-4-hydroxy-6- hydroxymethyldihydropteridine pyrophosphokinase [Sorangium cellulosum]|uniref:2-amino-4-hydroxy-6-hydroxymethyldihydropteridine pyrophosphokinase n=1 Tax=Sorangium cellulosum TaxID=56 RepID=A0A2L0F768_SORCE|nr:2-amino-4-hydroxy-6-hydroxymethyldihydropteridine diphosphokinase [Sorangium cellulosum]AUX47383.1 2-amino-4-hydroxy-6- hydroxymethyldihydropteridine pyrophosphokinase [Sorangium cellulosum]
MSAAVGSARRVVLGLGSNLGDRLGTLRAAVEALGADPALDVLQESPRYESPPAGGPPQGNYVNVAVLLATSLPAREILVRTLAVERSLGRTRPDAVRWGPRTIDIDVLWIEGESVAEPDLEVPHPRLCLRAFALRPLLDVAPDARDPRTAEPYAALPAASAPLRRLDEV